MRNTNSINTLRVQFKEKLCSLSLVRKRADFVHKGRKSSSMGETLSEVKAQKQHRNGTNKEIANLAAAGSRTKDREHKIALHVERYMQEQNAKRRQALNGGL